MYMYDTGIFRNVIYYILPGILKRKQKETIRQRNKTPNEISANATKKKLH